VKSMAGIWIPPKIRGVYLGKESSHKEVQETQKELQKTRLANLALSCRFFF
jgi:hypothetical protein